MTCAEKLMLPDGREVMIRPADGEDAPRMLKYMKQMLGETPFLIRTPEEFDYTAEEEAAILDRIKNDPRCLMLIAEAEGEIVACADISSSSSKSRVRHLANLGISVRKDFWKLGIGSALMERLISFAGEHEVEQVELGVVAENRRAMNLYMKYGFTVYGTRPHAIRYADGSYADEYLMYKRLSE